MEWNLRIINSHCYSSPYDDAVCFEAADVEKSRKWVRIARNKIRAPIKEPTNEITNNLQTRIKSWFMRHIYGRECINKWSNVSQDDHNLIIQCLGLHLNLCLILYLACSLLKWFVNSHSQQFNYYRHISFALSKVSIEVFELNWTCCQYEKC